MLAPDVLLNSEMVLETDLKPDLETQMTGDLTGDEFWFF